MITVEQELKDIFTQIETADYNSVQSPELLMNFGFIIQGWIARTGQLVADTKKGLHEARRMAALKVKASLEANGEKMPVSMVKEYVNDICSEQNHLYALADRCNSTCIHALDFIRTCLATLRAEREQSRSLIPSKPFNE